MGSWDWKNDKRLHAAIGLAVVVLALKWMFTDSLLRSVEVLQGNVTRDQWDNNVVTSVPVSTFLEGWLPLIYDGVVWLLVAVGSRVLFGAISGVTAVKSLVQKQSAVVDVKTQSVEAVVDTEGQLRSYVLSLGECAAQNDRTNGDLFWGKIREHRVREAFREAAASGDLETADAMLSELTGKAVKKRASNA